MAQSRRVWFTISMMVLIPRPSSPTSCAQAFENSTSLEALERLPSLSFNRRMKKWFLSPAAVHLGRRKQDNPLAVWARIKNASDIGAEQNHLCPVTIYSREFPIRSARVVFARTSE